MYFKGGASGLRRRFEGGLEGGGFKGGFKPFSRGLEGGLKVKASKGA